MTCNALNIPTIGRSKTLETKMYTPRLNGLQVGKEEGVRSNVHSIQEKNLENEKKWGSIRKEH